MHTEGDGDKPVCKLSLEGIVSDLQARTVENVEWVKNPKSPAATRAKDWDVLKEEAAGEGRNQRLLEERAG